MMKTIAHVFVVLAAVALSACSGGSDSKTPDAAVVKMDAAVKLDAAPTPTNALGQLCGQMTAACPTGHNCVIITGLGSQTTGYCSPSCKGAPAACTTGYTGPAGGQPQCVLGPMGTPEACAVACGTDANCPTGLKCLAVPGNMQGVKICAAPAA